MDIDIKEYKSHSGKFLQDHLNGVVQKVKKRTLNLPTTLNLKLAEIAALFHDVGKLNPNFQPKLSGEKANGYSSHAYLSAYAFWCFCSVNQNLFENWTTRREQLFSLLAMIARHHGNLPNFEDFILNQNETKNLSDFLKEKPYLPVSEFLHSFRGYEQFQEIIEKHNSFSLEVPDSIQNSLFNIRLLEERNTQPLKFFFETQFCFACLLEADKRDAGGNEVYNREILQKKYYEANFSNKIEVEFEKYAQKENKTDLDILRTEMREESVLNLRKLLNESDKRVFTLSAPTGAGKTMMLLALAKEIIAEKPYLSSIYALPFLAITEQVEGICRNIFFDEKNAVLRIDSRAENENIQRLQEKLDDEHTNDNVKRLLQEAFTETTFDHPFIITTFVQVFEALLSNKNARLLRLPNFSKTIFLIDEIQALPYRLYSFFVALLDEFCRQFDSYAIISTATMPHLDFPISEEAGRKLFANYQKPEELLNAKKYFGDKIFNRYQITQIKQDNYTVQELANFIKEKNESCLVILNTIDDTKDLYNLLSNFYSETECVLLNTHFTLEDRKTKIESCKERLENKEKIILISTQLIEAGVDIDFPTVYRDFCPLPSLIQSAGRCNRNGKLIDENGNLSLGNVYFFALQKENGKFSSELIYRDESRNFLEFCRKNLPEIITESELFNIQQKFFQTEIGEFLKFGVHKQYNEELNFVKLINKAAFKQLGKFKLIDEREFGFEFRYYIPKNEYDKEFENLQELTKQTFSRNFEVAMTKRVAIEEQIKKMSARIVTFRVRSAELAPAPDGEECCKIHKLGDLSKYNFESGIELSANAGCII